MATPTPTADTKIVIVAGEKFPGIPAATDNEAIRAQLVQTFPDIRNATIKKGTETIDGTTYETIEFIKTAGTKGAGLDLPAALAQVPPAWTPPILPASLDPQLRRLFLGELTVEEVLSMDLDALLADRRLGMDTYSSDQEPALCRTLLALPAVPTTSPVVGW